ncbi:unnamed protein product [Cuscuta campestris]|uniref:Retrotransposon Copia-like N-terminal domain-containing protein n=1 Tax=Cuscuta campestris TaxID=132261 RepID=A0A484MQI1_9ASTE|nr:unnamed protein product [Cuscuta campestris]
MAPTPAYSPVITKDTSVIQLHAKTHFPIKLVSTNFAIWQRQVRSTLIGLHLLGYIDGTMAAPPMILAESANPCYSIWFCQDQSIVGALFGSCSDQVQPLISNADTSHAAWTSLHSVFASASRGRVVSLKTKLGKNPRGDRSMDVLKEHERKLKAAEDTKAVVVATTNVTQHQRHSGGRSAVRDSYSHDSSSSSGVKRGSSGSRGSRFSKPSHSCQFCDIPGHDVKECRKLSRFLRTHGVNSLPTANATTMAGVITPP